MPFWCHAFTSPIQHIRSSTLAIAGHHASLPLHSLRAPCILQTCLPSQAITSFLLRSPAIITFVPVALLSPLLLWARPCPPDSANVLLSPSTVCAAEKLMMQRSIPQQRTLANSHHLIGTSAKWQMLRLSSRHFQSDHVVVSLFSSASRRMSSLMLTAIISRSDKRTGIARSS
jgi:hypothetical protein